MWSWPSKPLLESIGRPDRSTLISSESVQPADHAEPVKSHATGPRACENIGEHLRKRLPFEIDISSRVVHRRVEGSVAEPLTDRCKINTGLQQVDRGRVPQGVRMNALCAIGVDRFWTCGQTLLQ